MVETPDAFRRELKFFCIVFFFFFWYVCTSLPSSIRNVQFTTFACCCWTDSFRSPRSSSSGHHQNLRLFSMSIRLFLRHFVKPKLVVATLARDQNISGKNVRGLGFNGFQLKWMVLPHRIMKKSKSWEPFWIYRLISKANLAKIHSIHSHFSHLFFSL